MSLRNCGKWDLWKSRQDLEEKEISDGTKDVQNDWANAQFYSAALLSRA